MTSSSTRPGEQIGTMNRRRHLGRVSRAAAWLLWAAVCSAAVGLSVQAFAQVPNVGSQVLAPNAVIGTGNTLGNTFTSTTLNGANGPGYFVTGGATLSVNNALFENYVTSGGSGSGGGLGAGGAIFIDTGGSVTLNNTSFTHDTVIGGTGGTSSPYGGSLNNILANPAPPTSPNNGANGLNGVIYPDDMIIFGDGHGNGVPGVNATNGGNATNGFGGNGGTGGPGTNGWDANPVATIQLQLANLNVASASIGLAVDIAGEVTFVISAVESYADAGDPFEAPLAVTTGATNTQQAIENALAIVNDVLNLGNAVQSQILAQDTLNSWNNLVATGNAGNGGGGEAGGNGGAGSYGFGGGAGGQGGAYGLSANPQALDGQGGNGGNGGAGGFGGGGGAGGYAFGAGQNGSGIDPNSSISGTPGAGGTPGFGGGVGSTGGVTGGVAQCGIAQAGIACGGSGGDGYGGAIFVNAGGTLTITGNATFSGNSAIGGNSLNGGLAGGAAGTDLFMMTGAIVNIAPGAGNVITFNGTIADNSNASIGTPTFALGATYPVSGGAGLTIYAGSTVFNGANTYSGQTVINGGALGNLGNSALLNPGTNTTGTPNYALTDGSLQAADGIGLPRGSNLNFSGPSQFTGGVLQIAGVVLSNGVVQPTTFTRSVNPQPNPDGGSNPGGVQWTGSGGFAALNAPLTVTLSNNAPLAWGTNGFVPFGYSLIFGSATSNNAVTFTNPIDITGGLIGSGTAASFLVGNNGNVLGSTAIMSGVISGNGDLSIGGGGFNGTLILTANNTYTGATVINSGTLELSGAGSIVDSSSLTILGTGSLDISNSTSGAIVPTLSGSGSVLLGGQELTVLNSGSFSGVIADGPNGTKGSLIVSSGATETLSGTNTYTGDTTIENNATLVLIGTGSISDSAPVLVNGTFDISQTALGASITTLSGSGTGQVFLGSNMLVITAGAAGASGTSLNGVFAGVISDGGLGGMLAITGGNQTLSGVNTYTGATIINSGATLALQGGGSIADSIAVLDNGSFDISLTTTGASITTLAGTGTAALGSKTLTITAGSTIFAGVIADGGFSGASGGKLDVSGGTETLTGTNTYSGTTTIDHGATLALAGTGSISQSSGVVDNGLFDISQTSLGTAITTLSGSDNVALGSKLLLITAGGAGPSGTSAPGVFSGVIADSGGAVAGTGGMLAVTGGVETLSGTNTYTGGTLIGSGATLALSGTGAIANSAVVIDNGTFDISRTTSGASITTLMGNGLVSLGAQELTITAGSTTFAGMIADGGFISASGGSLIVTGGTETLSGANTYTGDTTIDASGKLALNGTGSIATSSVVQLATGGTFDISQTTGGASIKTLADTAAGQAGNVFLGSQTLTITNGSSTFSGVIADGGIGGGAGGGLTVTGGTQTLAGLNTYTGLTTVAPTTGTATLALKGSGSIATSSGVSVANNGTFDISRTSLGASITTLSGSGSVALGGQLLTITAGAAGPDGANPAGIFSGTIGDGGIGGGSGGALAITGGHQELTGVNTYTGGTTVSNGATLSINNVSSLGAATSPLTLNNGTLVVDASITIPQPVKVLGTADTINLNTNNVTLTGNITGNGSAILSAINGGTLNLNQTLPNTVSGLGGLVLGPGTSLIASSAANAGLAGTPIVVVPGGGGSPANLFTGSVHVVGPLDVVNTSTGTELIILPGDSLVGVGSVNVPTIIQGGGTNAPGDAPGAITSPASITQLAGSTYTVQIDGPLNSFTNCPNPPNANGCAGQYSTTVVTGAGNTYTAAGTLAPTLTGWGAPGPLPSKYIPPVTTSFIIVQAEGGVLGSFSSIMQPAQGVPGVSGGLPAGTRFDALYGPDTPTPFVNANAITLYVTPANYQNLSYWGVSLSENQSQVAGAVNALRGTAGVRNSPGATVDLAALFTQQPSALPHDFDTLSGEANADAALGVFQVMSQFLELMLEPAVNGRSGAAGSAALGFAAEDAPAQPLEVASAYGQVLPAVKATSFDQRWRAWGSAYGAANATSGDPTLGTHDFTGTAFGFVGGMDYRWSPDSVIGFAVGSGGTQWSLADALGGGRSYGMQAGVYGKSYFGPAYLAVSFGVANQWVNTDRYAFSGEHLTADFLAQSFGGRLEAGYRYAMPWAAVTPYVAGQALAFYTPSYTENDGGGGSSGSFALAYNAATAFDVRSEIGARFDSILPSFSDMQLVWRGRAAWQHEWLNNPALTATFATALTSGALPGAATSFTVNGANVPSNSAIFSTGFDLHVTQSLSIGAAIDSVLATSAQTYGGSATLRYRW
jgi:autotransporter-associated beta strand protein